MTLTVRHALLLALCGLPLASVAQPTPDGPGNTEQRIGIQPRLPVVHECDRLAQPLRQSMGRLPALVDGVDYASLRWPAARAACTRAMSENPGVVRFLTFAARAADKGGDAREAARLYRLAADEGDALAQSNLGAMYQNGEGGLPRSDRDAVQLFRLAADQGFPAGQSNLAVYYTSGRGGVTRNDREAVQLWRSALEYGDVQAQNNLGKMYAEGRGGLPRDMGQAVSMWRMAAEQGNAEARGNLRKAGAR